MSVLIKVSRCGDGVVDRDVAEQCDDGNDNNNDDCVRESDTCIHCVLKPSKMFARNFAN